MKEDCFEEKNQKVNNTNILNSKKIFEDKTINKSNIYNKI